MIQKGVMVTTNQALPHELAEEICTDLEIGPAGLLTGRPLGPVCIDRHKREAAERIAKSTGPITAIKRLPEATS